MPGAGPHIDLDAGRKVKLDADVVLLTGGMIALLEPREVVVVRDVDHDSEHRIERGSGHIDGPCDGRTAWTGRLQSPVELSFSVFGCVDRFAAVPAEAVAMLVPPGQRSIDETTVAELSAGEVVAFDAALTRAGWEATTNDYSRAHRRFSDGSGGMSRYYWFGPCGPAHDQDRNTQTEVMWHDGEVIVSKRPCE